MAETTFKGNPVHTNGNLPPEGKKAPDFTLTTTKLEDVTLQTFAGKRKVISTNMSFDTGTCANTARAFNEKAASLDNTVVLLISADLPFAQKRFCEAEGLDNVVALSMMRGRQFAKDYGLLLTDGPLEGVIARAVIVLDENDQVLHSQLPPDIAKEPDYDAALKALG